MLPAAQGSPLEEECPSRPKGEKEGPHQGQSVQFYMLVAVLWRLSLSRSPSPCTVRCKIYADDRLEFQNQVGALGA